MKKKLLFILLLSSICGIAQQSGEVIITEIYNRPQKPSQAELDATMPPAGVDTTPNEGHTEWFEIYNTTSSPIVMDGWEIRDESSSSRTSTISSFTLAANSYAVFSGYNIPAAHGGVTFDYFYDYKKPSFNNESSYSDTIDTTCPDGVSLNKPDGAGGFDLVDVVLYDYGYDNYITNGSSCDGRTTPVGLPSQGRGSRKSFGVSPASLTATGNDDPANWEFSTNVYDSHNSDQLGTPGSANTDIGTILSLNNFVIDGVSLATYPIPANEKITVDGGDLKISELKIYSITGQVLATSNESSINVEKLTSGAYILEVSSNNKKASKLVVVNN